MEGYVNKGPAKFDRSVNPYSGEKSTREKSRRCSPIIIGRNEDLLKKPCICGINRPRLNLVRIVVSTTNPPAMPIFINRVYRKLWNEIANVISVASNEARGSDQCRKRWNSLVTSAREINETCSNINQILETYYLTTMYSIEFILGLIGNTIVICGYIFCLKEWKCSNIYLFNLSISDLIFICTLPMFVVYYANNKRWVFGNFLCKLNRYILYTNMYLSILFLVCISIDRYLLVSNPLRFHIFQRRRTAIFICIALWIFVTLEIVPTLTFIGADGVTAADNSTFIKCVDYASSGNPSHNLIYNMCLTFFGFLLPMCIMGVFCVQTARKLNKINQERIRNVTLEKPLTLVILAIVIFSALFTPYHILRTARMVSRLEVINLSDCTIEGIKAAYAIARPIAFLSTITNPIFYFLAGDKFRETITSSIKSLCSRNAPQHSR
uniref:succinate receptor 1-like n=1 Tax=Pristiophorus japonicus TaxID=55135 RepID=UPI00398E7EAC